MARKKAIKVVEQKSDWDCGAASLAMLLPFTLAEISATARARYPKVRKEGMAIYEMEGTAELLGHKLKRIYRKKDYLVGQTGVLGVKGSKEVLQGGEHWVVLKDGTHIVDPWDSTIWKLEDYMKHAKGRPVTLLVVEA